MGACLSANIDPDSPRDHSPSRANEHVTGLPTGGNRPLVSKAVQAWKSDTPLTPEALKRMRDEFWDTAPSYSGRSEIWQALRAACEAPSLTLAQAIVDSANMTVPTGKLTDGCYDELGNNYRIPNYCVLEPTNLLPPAAAAASTSPTVTDPSSSTSPLLPTPAGGVGGGGGGAGTPARGAPLSSSPPAPSSLTAAAAAVATPATPTGPPISITARLSIGRDVKMPGISRDTTVAQIKAAVLAAAESDVSAGSGGAGGSGARLKVFYLGRMMPDDKTVREIGVAEGGVVQVMVIPSV
ncbi:Ubiquitin domain-containing protein 2 [Geranomyces variabilis]|uniref:Ubiquitin domain-containing protein 2 n=1 Tax=Geranomyces variabilis TaxID=109894 RepID=A0AAD5XUY9_9FUNG|nr:Ubiquitin domain-containing protein 2 [Geranomyces variabilis]